MRRGVWGPESVAAILGAVLVAGCSTASSGHGSPPAETPSATTTLRAAAQATADARSFTFAVPSVQVIYQAPDAVEQVEHGQGSISSSSGVSTAPFAETITKIFIGDRYYEADTSSGESPTFSVAKRCASDKDAAATALLQDLRAIAADATAEKTAGGYSFHIPPSKAEGMLVPTSGVATLQGGYVRTLNFYPSHPPGWVVTSVNNSSPVTAPPTATPMNLTCSS
jgi:hypothetical protein